MALTLTHRAAPSGRTLDLLNAIRARPRGAIREWQADLGWSTTSVVEYHLWQLRHAGIVTWTPRPSRSVVLLDGSANEDCARCGRLEQALERITEAVTSANAYPECVARVQELVEEALR